MHISSSSSDNRVGMVLSGRILWWKTLTLSQQDSASGQPFSHHGDQMGALGKGPEVVRNDAE